jgi:hypothetical protein
MDMLTITTVFSLLACIISGISLTIGLYCMVKLIAMEKSTHSIQYVPIDEEWATDSKDIEKINKSLKEEKEEVFYGI